MNMARQLKEFADLIEQEMDQCENQADLDVLDGYHRQVVKDMRALSAKAIKEDTEAYIQLSKSISDANAELKATISDVEKVGKRIEKIAKIFGKVCKYTAKALDLIT